MNLIFKEHGFAFLQAEKSSKSKDLVFCKFKKTQNSMNLIFGKLKKPQKTWIQFLQA